jgi:cell wall-associated NlpC family hydrolase
MEPAGAAELFFRALVAVPGWATMEPWTAAQAVQRSAYADGRNYKLSFNLARRVVALLGGATCRSAFVGDVAVLPGAPAAVSRALGMVGKHGYYQLCARLAARIWGRANSGFASAAEQWATMVATGNAHPDDRRPPVGALVFWDTGGPYGHVAVYVGGDRIVSNDVGDSVPGEGGVYLVDMSAVEIRWGATYRGWSPPIYGV